MAAAEQCRGTCPSKAERRQAKERGILRLVQAAKAAAVRADIAEAKLLELTASATNGEQYAGAHEASDMDAVTMVADRLSCAIPFMFTRASGTVPPHPQKLRRNVGLHAAYDPDAPPVSSLSDKELRVLQRRSSLSSPPPQPSCNHGLTGMDAVLDKLKVLEGALNAVLTRVGALEHPADVVLDSSDLPVVEPVVEHDGAVSFTPDAVAEFVDAVSVAIKAGVNDFIVDKAAVRDLSAAFERALLLYQQVQCCDDAATYALEAGPVLDDVDSVDSVSFAQEQSDSAHAARIQQQTALQERLRCLNEQLESAHAARIQHQAALHEYVSDAIGYADPASCPYCTQFSTCRQCAANGT